jgi:HK97 family phage prohead protease
MERKAIAFEVKDLDLTKRTAIIAHAAYDNIDRTGDISRKGMFNRSWNNNKGDISFYLNHDDKQAPGKVVDVYEDDKYAYTKVWLGTHTLGEDTLKMMDEEIIKKASFGYITIKSNMINVEGKKVRELKEAAHLETSVLTVMPANAKAGVINVTKAFEGISEADIKGFYEQLTAMEKFCRNTKASDGCIQNMLIEVQNTKEFIQEYNTAFTQPGKPLDSNASIWNGWFK